MRAKFIRGSDGLGLQFEPESLDEQLLLEIFVRESAAAGHRFRFHGFEYNGHGRPMREDLTAVRGELHRGAPPSPPEEKS